MLLCWDIINSGDNSGCLAVGRLLVRSPALCVDVSQQDS